MLRLIESSRNNLDLVLDEDNIKLIACNGIDSIDKLTKITNDSNCFF